MNIEHPHIHPRVLELRTSAGFEWLLSCWQNPGGARRLHEQLKPVFEATLLSSLSSPPMMREEVNRHRAGVRLFVFDEIQGIAGGLAQLGFTPYGSGEEAHLAPAMKVLAEDAATFGLAIPPNPVSSWRVELHRPDTALENINQEMSEKMGADVWGATPGGPSRLFAVYADALFRVNLQPDLESLDRFVELVSQDQAAGVRWIPPLLFQALCDFVGVVATEVSNDVEVQWALCRTLEGRNHTPPSLRLIGAGEQWEVPVGLHLMRSLVMPQSTQEPLSVWLTKQLRGTPTVH